MVKLINVGVVTFLQILFYGYLVQIMKLLKSQFEHRLWRLVYLFTVGIVMLLDAMKGRETKGPENLVLWSYK